MFRNTLSRHAGLCRRVVLAAPPTRLVSQATSIPGIQTRAIGPRLVYRALSSQPHRFSPADAAASVPIPDESVAGAPKEVTRFTELRDLGFDDRLVESITSGMKYEQMTQVQSMTINEAMAGKDLVAQAKTGTGKTLAFLVPTIQKMLQANPNMNSRTARSDDIQAIVISPTRELAEQIGSEARKLCRGTGIVVQTAVGGTQKSSMLRETQRRGCHLLVATPGRLNDLLSDPRTGIAAPNLRCLVLDEADRMLDVGFQQELESILEQLPSRRDVPRQTLLFSATIPRNVIQLARNFVDAKNFSFVQTIKEDDSPTHEKIPQHIVVCKEMANVFPTLVELITRELQLAKETPGRLPFKAMVFLPTKYMVQYASDFFKALRRNERNLPYVMDIHSGLSQAQRTRAAQNFKDATSGILLSSDVTARGMDFPNVSHVIQVHAPSSRDQYIHRVGRTGRADKPGEGWLLITQPELYPARRRLVDLPLKQHRDLKCASFEAKEGIDEMEGAPSEFQIAEDMGARVPLETREEAYRSMLGGAMKGVEPQELVDGLNKWASVEWRMDTPPPVTQKAAQSIRARGLNIKAFDRNTGRDFDRHTGRDFDRRGGRNFGGARDRKQPIDGWSRMESSQGRNNSRYSKASF
ncbi:DEAD-domain-containing protein [Thozetella sp. PMI_491]|nr:DEAD-domain-containing protein [Thozetella sp. PMI_491]